jgi:hypothetical protein
MNSALQDVYLNIPKSDVRLVKELAKKMGWIIEYKESILKKYLHSRPKQVDLSDEDIMSEIYAVRYQ